MQWWSRIMDGCGALAALVLGATLVLVCGDVIGRNLGSRSLPWIVEVTEYALPLATLLAAPWLLFRGEHIRLDVLQQLLPVRARRRVDLLAAALGLSVCLTVAWYGIEVILDSRAIGSQVMKTLVFPEWWLFVPLPVSFAFMAAECLRRLVTVPATSEPGAAADGET